MKKIILALSLISFSYSCAHYPDVRPGEVEHRVVVSAEDEQSGFKNAMGQASDYCDDAQNNKKSVIVKETKKYTGSMDEETYKNTKTASNLIGGVANVLGGKKEKKTGKSISNIDLGKPYEVTLVFKCN